MVRKEVLEGKRHSVSWREIAVTAVHGEVPVFPLASLKMFASLFSHSTGKLPRCY